MCYLGWAEGVKFEIGIKFLQLAEKVCIIVKTKLRIMTALKLKLLTSITESFLDLYPIGFNISNVRFRMTGNHVEIAEFTVGHTNVGGVHVPVYDPGNFTMRHLFFPQLVSNKHQFGQRCMLKKKNAFFSTQEIKTQGAFVQRG